MGRLLLLCRRRHHRPGKIHSSFFHVSVSRLILAIDTIVAMMTHRIDEVEAGGEGGGGAVEMVEADVA